MTNLNILENNDMTIDELAYQLTAYEKLGVIDYEDGLIDLLVYDYLEEAETLDIIWKWNEYCQDNENYYDEYYYNDDEFFNTYFNSNEPMRIIRATYFGDYRYNDNWIKFNAYGNLNSFDDWEVFKNIKEDSDFKMWLLENEEIFSELLEDENKNMIIKKTLELVRKGY